MSELEDNTENGKNNNDVKSSSVVKYQSTKNIVKYRELEKFTDLKMHPSNWLRDAFVYEMQDYWQKRSHSAFHNAMSQSFKMAHEFVDCVNDVDFIADSAVIKRLLKMPLSKSQVSVIVHRVGSTLLLDDFDINASLLLQEQENWKWFKEFLTYTFLEDLRSRKKHLTRTQKSQYALMEKTLRSNFIHYSLLDQNEKETKETTRNRSPVPTQEICDEQESDNPSVPFPTDLRMQRAVVWKFENIQMLLKTNLPIFGGGNRPLVSLRLHDLDKPINVLTGLDYWLDNLMSNVPEIAMCYHLDGLVQKYELLKTSEIPDLEGSEFSPSVVKDIAQNILSFFNNNCTKQGHTYWLFKAHNDDIVKLYDLTSISEEYKRNAEVDTEVENPFSRHVALLMYRVAKNLFINTEFTRSVKQRSIINTLLANSLTLLSEEEYPELCASMHYMQCQLLVPDAPDMWQSWNDNENEESSSDSDLSCDDDLPVESQTSSVASTSLAELKQPHYLRKCPLAYKQFQLATGVEECCLAAIASHAKALQVYTGANNELRSAGMLKSTVAYYTLAEQHFNRFRYNKAINCIHLATVCLNFFQRINKTITMRRQEMWSLIFRLCADIHVMSHQTKEKAARSEQHSQIEEEIWSDEDKRIYAASLDEPFVNGLRKYFKLLIGKVASYHLALEIYTRGLEAIDAESTKYHIGEIQKSLRLRIYNVYNELGKVALREFQNMEDNTEAMEKVLIECQNYFDIALNGFQELNDKENTALVLLNLAHLMRSKVALLNRDEKKDVAMTSQERACYKKAIDLYKQALIVIGDHSPDIRSAINYELSSIYFTMAMLIQDFSTEGSCNKQQVENEVIDLLTNSEKHCQLSDTFPNDVRFSHLGLIYRRLGSLYHQRYRETNALQLSAKAETYYTDSVTCFQKTPKSNPLELLRIQLERVALLEHHSKSVSNVKTQHKLLKKALGFVLDACPIIAAIDYGKLETNDEAISLVGIAISRLQFLLLSLHKYFINLKTKKPSSDLASLKNFYQRSLHLSPDILIQDSSEFSDLCKDVQAIFPHLNF